MIVDVQSYNNYNVYTMVDVKELTFFDKMLLYRAKRKPGMPRSLRELAKLKEFSYERKRCPGCDRELPPVIHHWYDSSRGLHWVAVCPGCNHRLGWLFKNGYPNTWEEQLKILRERVAWRG